MGQYIAGGIVHPWKSRTIQIRSIDNMATGDRIKMSITTCVSQRDQNYQNLQNYQNFPLSCFITADTCIVVVYEI